MVTTLPMDQSDIPMNTEIDKLSTQLETTTVAESKALAFSGNPGDSVAEFIQAVQKYVFEQDRASDDRWIAGYVGTCFSDAAALWYSNLDDRTRNSWNRLRKSLTTRYGPAPQYSSAPFVGQGPNMLPPDSPYITPLPPVQRPPFGAPQFAPYPTREKAPNELRGRIEVFVPDRNLWLGFLTYAYDSYGTGMSFSVSGAKEGSTTVSFVPDSDGKPVQLRVEDGSFDVQHPYVGLALEESQPQIPGQPGYWPQPVYPAVPRSACLPSCHTCYPFGQFGPASPQILPPMGQSGCLQQSSQGASTPSTWALKPCTESRKEERYRRAAKTTNLWERASSAVWKYDADTKELAISWLGDDGNEEQLAASVPKMSGPYVGSIRPAFRRTQDKASETPNPGHLPTWPNVPVKFFFSPED